jgi:hypothetical protein
MPPMPCRQARQVSPWVASCRTEGCDEPIHVRKHGLCQRCYRAKGSSNPTRSLVKRCARCEELLPSAAFPQSPCSSS